MEEKKYVKVSINGFIFCHFNYTDNFLAFFDLSFNECTNRMHASQVVTTKQYVQSFVMIGGQNAFLLSGAASMQIMLK